MALTLAPDFEKVVADYLRDTAEVAAFIDRRVVTKPPDETSRPWVQIVQLDGRQVDTPDHLVECYFQLDCYAGKTGGQPEAVDIALAVRAALAQINRADHDAAVVSGARINGFARIPDPDLLDSEGHDRERVIVTATVWMHV